ncbi:hypothetical protein IT575_01835 [bacterium]|nr:hypothetical protein [bacterium]
MPRQVEQSFAQKRFEPGWIKQQRRVELAVWAFLLAAPLLLLLGLNAGQPRFDPAVAGIGNPVFDDFIQVLLRDGGLDQPMALISELRLSPAAWDELAARHSKDPRLYELRALIVVPEPGKTEDEMQDFFEFKDASRKEALALLQERGLQSVSLELFGLEQQHRTWLEEATREMEMQPPGAGASRAQIDLYSLAQHQHARAAHGAQQLAAYETLAARAPDEGAIWYSLALQDCEAGDWKAAVKHLARGNDAASCSALRGSPLEDYYLACAAGRPPADPLSGACLASLENVAQRASYYSRRWPLEACLQYCQDSGDHALQAELFIALCRMARAPGCSPMESMFFLHQIDSMLAGYRSTPQITSSDPRLSRLEQELSSVKSQIRSFFQNSATRANWNSGGGPLQNLQLQLVQRWQGYSGQGYEADMYQDSRDWNHLLAPGGSIHEALKGMEDFDWVSLSWHSGGQGTPAAAAQE